LEQHVAERTADLAHANAELSQHNRENEMFVYSVSHDLRTPLVSLQGFSNELTLAAKDLTVLFDSPAMPSELADRGRRVLADDVATSVRFIQSAVIRLAGIIDALLRLSRAGRVEYQPTSIDVEALVRRVIDVQHAEILHRGVVAEIQPMPKAWGDAFAIEQLFANLLDNAIKYLATDRPGRITVGVADPAKDELQRLVLFVRDNGIGIPEQGRQKIFRAFERLHPEHSSGEGIGLAVVERIVERHRGRIWVESTPGEGSVFYIALPGPPSERS
jgi:signal transduction histidine kinase